MVIVEDDDDVLALLELMFELDERFEVVGSAASGDTATALAAQFRPDALVLDLELPRVGGLTALPLIRAASPHTRIVVFSGFADPVTLFEVLRMGADAYLDKASAWSELLPTIAELFQHAEV